MSKEDLIPINKRTKAEQKVIQALATKAKQNNPNMVFASKLREMKKRVGMNNTDLAWFVECLDNPKSNVMSMLKFLEEKKDNMDPKDYLSLRDRLHRTLFGDKININKHVVNINMEMSKKDSNELLELLRENT